jgi:hypothetical protein
MVSVIALVIARIVIVVVIAVPGISPIRVAPIRVTVRHSPACVPVERVVRISEVPIPVMIPRLANHYVIISCGAGRTVKTVNPRRITVVNDNLVIVIILISVVTGLLLINGNVLILLLCRSSLLTGLRRVNTVNIIAVCC